MNVQHVSSGLKSNKQTNAYIELSHYNMVSDFFFIATLTYLHTLQNYIIYTTHITILKLHTTYILAVLVAYNFIPYFYCLLYRKQTNGTKQIPKLTCTINWGYNSYFRLLFTSLLTTQKLVKSLLTFKIS